MAKRGPTLLTLYRSLASAQQSYAVNEAKARHYREVVADLKFRILAAEREVRLAKAVARDETFERDPWEV